MALVERAKAILQKPKETWPVIEAETDTVAELYLDYACRAALACNCRRAGDVARNAHADVMPRQGSALKCRIGRPGAIDCAAAIIALLSMP
jgi:hypothetical protein